MKFLALLLIIFWLGFTPVAQADMCRDRFDGRVCILKLKRSAKNYWEYRAKVSIDGKKQKNIEIYNCRDRTLTRKGKYPIPFKPDSPGELVCKTFQRQMNTYKASKW
ncbi:hypothetical protein I4641_07960 [Waterburya agarophytonicola K14]|uniref:Uncharacterized protein n=1 Tax=Waterburya agarophytonicola KI4 TaxID=2874699 RepID=A0A964BRG0_9CYAN|nr:hypothetical protein [Waterburya agarophytonicola KI4]